MVDYTNRSKPFMPGLQTFISHLYRRSILGQLLPEWIKVTKLGVGRRRREGHGALLERSRDLGLIL